MDTFVEWEATVLDLSYENVDYPSLYIYCNNNEEDTPNILARSLDMDHFLNSVAATCDYIQAKKKINLSLDEWNVWKSQGRSRAEKRWQIAPPDFEDVYTLEDALVVSSISVYNEEQNEVTVLL